MNSKDLLRGVLMRAITVWLVIMLAGTGLFLLVPMDGDHPVDVMLMRSIGSFVAILAFFVGRESRVGEGKVLAFVYSMFFSLHIVLGLTALVSAPRVIGVYAAFHLIQYESLLYNGLLLIVCTYVLGAVVLPNVSHYYRAILAVVIAGALISSASLPFLINPNHLYTLPDVTDFRIIDRAKQELSAEGITHSSPGDVAERISLSHWQGTTRIGELDSRTRLARVEELFPYLKGFDYVPLVYRPMHELHTLLSIVCIVLLAGFFVINYLRDPPKPAHFEKIHLTLLVYCVFEYFHSTTLASATTFEQVVALDRIGKYLTTIVLFLFIGLFFARARFLSLSEGVFYEERLVGNPEGISRWRDGIDNFLIRQFVFKPRLRNRFVVQRPKQR